MIHKWVYRDVAYIYDVFQNYMTCSYFALDLLKKMSSVDASCIEMVIYEIR